MMRSLLEFSGVSEESVKAAHTTILAILESRADEKTKRLALESLKGLCTPPQNISIANCHLEAGKYENSQEV